MRNTGEVIKPTTAVLPQSVTTADTLFNNTSSGGTNGIDTVDHDGAVIVFNAGALAATSTIDVTIVDSADNDSSNATLITGATFVQVTDSVGEDTKYVAFINLEGKKRFIWAKVVKTGAGAAIYQIDIILGEGKKFPEVNSLVFDIE